MKKIIYFWLICSVTVFCNAMDLVDVDKKLQKSDDKLNVKSKTVINKSVKHTPRDKVLDIPGLNANSSATKGDLSIDIPPLNLPPQDPENDGLSNFQRIKSKKVLPKHCVNSHDDLKAKVRLNTASNRSQSEPSRTSPSVTPVSSRPSPKKKIMSSSGPIDDMELIQSLDTEKKYSNEEVWNFIKAANPTLFTFAQRHNLSLDKVNTFGEMMEQMTVEPQAVIEFLKEHHKLSNAQSASGLLAFLSDVKPSAGLLSRYQNIKKENPEHWNGIILEIIKELSDQEEGVQGQSPLTHTNGTHIGLLEDEVAANKATIRQQWFALGITVLTTILPLVWGTITTVLGASSGGSTNVTG